MQVGMHAVIVDEDTKAVAAALTPVFEILGRQLEDDYGGMIDHVWIDVELLEYLANADGSPPPYPFRFQKRVAGCPHFGLPAAPSQFNVGHFSVRPDFALLTTLPREHAVGHALQSIYSASELLLDKQRKLGGFDASQFRERFFTQCRHHGYMLNVRAMWKDRLWRQRRSWQTPVASRVQSAGPDQYRPLSIFDLIGAQ